MRPIESVRILTPQIQDGGVTKPCLAVTITPWPDNVADITQIGDDIKAAVMAFNRKQKYAKSKTNI